jgi:Uma2 family endonuclease
MATKTLLTIAEFDRLPQQEGLRYELDEGELLTMTFPNPRHNLVAINVQSLLREFVRAHSLGVVFPSDTGYILERDPGVLRGPDASFVRAGRLKDIDLEHNIPGAPDLAVEVVSPNDHAQDLNKKVKQYLKAGCQVVWVVYPVTREVEVFEAGGGVRRLTEADFLEAPDLLPGFRQPVRLLFEQA